MDPFEDDEEEFFLERSGRSEIDILSDSCCRQLSFQHHGFKTCKIHESPLYDDLQNNYGFYTMAPPALGRQIVFKKTLRPGVELSVWKDDLTTHAVDAVVNAANGDLQHGGGLARALVSAGGYEIQEESRSFVARYGRVPTGEIAVTGAGRLPCKLIIHAVGPRWTKRDKERCIEQLKRVIRNILDYVLYENLDIQSVAIPAISSGIFQFPLDLCTCIIVETIKAYNYYKLVVNQLKEIHLVSNENATTDSFKRASELILGRNELDSWLPFNEFTRELNGSPKYATLMTGKTQGLSFGIVSSPQYAAHEMQIGAITFQVAIGDITKERADVIVNSTTKTFNGKSGVSKAILERAGPAVEKECAKLAARAHQDFIVTQGGSLNCQKIIHVNGSSDVRKTVYRVLQETKERQYTSVCLPALGTGNAGKKPAKVADDIISGVADFTQKHFSGSLSFVKVVLFLPHLLSVFYNSMKNRESHVLPAIQFPTSETAGFSNASYFTGDVPQHWTSTKQQHLQVVQLPPGQSEYNNVKSKFKQTCPSNKIEKIERIENVNLWQCYQLKKKQMDIKNGHTNNEEILFHGTDVDSLPHVNQHGFNRSYAGKNAAVYGKGTYFAVDASYSADDRYSKPDRNGRKHMYVVRVLTGDYTRGHAHLVSPPAKNSVNSTEVYDSVTDDPQNPKIFVVFNDNHSYPEYLITFLPAYS